MNPARGSTAPSWHRGSLQHVDQVCRTHPHVTIWKVTTYLPPFARSQSAAQLDVNDENYYGKFIFEEKYQQSHTIFGSVTVVVFVLVAVTVWARDIAKVPLPTAVILTSPYLSPPVGVRHRQDISHAVCLSVSRTRPLSLISLYPLAHSPPAPRITTTLARLAHPPPSSTSDVCPSAALPSPLLLRTPPENWECSPSR